MVDSNGAVLGDRLRIEDTDTNTVGRERRISEPLTGSQSLLAHQQQEHDTTQRISFPSPMTTRKKPFSPRLRLAPASPPPQPPSSHYNLFSNQLKAMGTVSASSASNQQQTQGGGILPSPPLSKKPVVDASISQQNQYHSRIATHHWMTAPEGGRASNHRHYDDDDDDVETDHRSDSPKITRAIHSDDSIEDIDSPHRSHPPADGEEQQQEVALLVNESPERQRRNSSSSFAADSSSGPLSPAHDVLSPIRKKQSPMKPITSPRAFGFDGSSHHHIDQYAKGGTLMEENNSNHQFSPQSPIDRRLRQSVERRQRKSGASAMDSSDLEKYLKGKYGKNEDGRSSVYQSSPQTPRDRRIRQSVERRQRKSQTKEASNNHGNDDDSDNDDDDDDDSFEYLVSPGAFSIHSIGAVDQHAKGKLTQHPNTSPDPQPPLSPPFLSDDSPLPTAAGNNRRKSNEQQLTSASCHGPRSHDRNVNSNRIFGDSLHLSLHSPRDTPRVTGTIAARRPQQQVDPPIMRGSQHGRTPMHLGIMPSLIDEGPVGDTPTPSRSVSLDSSMASIGRSMVRVIGDRNLNGDDVGNGDGDDEPNSKADDNCCHQQNRVLWSIVVALVLISAIGFGVGVGARKSSPSGLPPPTLPPNNADPSDDVPLLRPTLAPSNNKDDLLLESLWAWILDEGISDAESLKDLESAPYRALHWLAFQDPLQLPVPVKTADNNSTAMTHEQQAFLERYVASVLYFATNERFDFRVQENSVCSWHTKGNKGIYCRGENAGYSNGDIGVTHIVLPRAFLEGFFPPELCSLPNLVHIDFSHNSLASLPENIGKCSQLESLLLGDNPWGLGTEINGLPSSLFELTNLKELQLYQSFLEVSLPSTIGMLTQLEVLQLTSNKIYGTIPRQLWDLSTLQFLDLGFNDIEGGISSTIFNTNLTHLLLGTNILEGTLPSQIGALANLVQLDLSSNYLTGEVPNEFSLLSNLVALDLSGNFDLTGSLDGLCNSTSMKILPAGDEEEAPCLFFANEQLVCACCTKIED
ncbi:unnamed protein product [Cylindrotheca closterium]|uniref:Uncharacterized protein n=1 Tax=Cylindrotheca closterium TaxID=2856 RepID=A0AAD2JN66_9STRA|nr:unnamed protein product [Cylindrotheca closterium]